MNRDRLCEVVDLLYKVSGYAAQEKTVVQYHRDYWIAEINATDNFYSRLAKYFDISIPQACYIFEKISYDIPEDKIKTIDITSRIIEVIDRRAPVLM